MCRSHTAQPHTAHHHRAACACCIPFTPPPIDAVRRAGDGIVHPPRPDRQGEVEPVELLLDAAETVEAVGVGPEGDRLVPSSAARRGFELNCEPGPRASSIVSPRSSNTGSNSQAWSVSARRSCAGLVGLLGPRPRAGRSCNAGGNRPPGRRCSNLSRLRSPRARLSRSASQFLEFIQGPEAAARGEAGSAAPPSTTRLSGVG